MTIRPPNPPHQNLDEEPRFPAARRPRRRAGFTLLEMVGVLAVTMILASMVFTASLKQLSLLNSQQESTNLLSYANALQNGILRNRYVPGPADWAAVVATELGASPTAVATNACGQPRLLLVDPQLQIGRAGGGLPYAQTNFLTGSVVTNGGVLVPPVSPRLVLVSSLGPALPSLSASDFNVLWTNADGTLPPGAAWTGWRGSGSDLCAQRINLAPLFVRLTLGNCFATNLLAIDSLTLTNVPGGLVDGYFLQGTVVTLGVGARVDTKLVAAADTPSLLFQAPPVLTTNAPGITASAMGLTAAWFASSPANGYSGVTYTPSAVMSSVTNYMGAYVKWANNGFQSSGGAYGAVVSANSLMQTALQNLVQGFTSGNCH